MNAAGDMKRDKVTEDLEQIAAWTQDVLILAQRILAKTEILKDVVSEKAGELGDGRPNRPDS